MKRTAVGLAWLFLAVATAVASEVGFIEDFSLAKDRTASLRQLIPGTEDYYYYHCLHFLNTDQYEKAEEMTKPWHERFGQTGRLTEIQTRHALLTYEKNPQRALDYLKHRLGLTFDHQRQLLDEAPNLPIALDPTIISRETLKGQSFARWGNLDNFEDSALDWLAAENLTWERRRNLLQRMQRPDHPNLPRLVSEDLGSPHAQDFGSFPIHMQMTLAQLDELVKLRPNLLNHTNLVRAWIMKLRPTDDEDWQRTPAQAKAYFDRLLTFVRRLEPVHNPLKAHVLFHRLAFDRAQGTYDKELFLEYLKLPRQQGYMSKAMLESQTLNRFPADLNAQYQDVTVMQPVGTDEPLVRDYLKHFFMTADSPAEFAPYINDIYLRHLFAETKIETGSGEPEQWASQLPPDQFRQLKDRIDIDFSPANKTHFAAEEAVKLDLSVKNVPTLIVKVFEINTQHYYRTRRQEVDTDISLDGLIANTEETHNYTEPPLRRVAKRFEFPQLKKPGVYVIDFIGGGKSSRVLIRKGRLRPLVHSSTAGEAVTVVDDANRPVKDAILWLGGQEYFPDKDGVILLPFSTNPGRQPVVISQGDFACLEHLDHHGEGYHLAAGIHVDRESLLSQRIAQLIVRPALYLNGKPVSLKLLEEIKLRITATDQSGIATSTEIPNFKVFEDRDSIHEFRVPSRLAALNVTLQAKVKSLSQNKPVDVAAGQNFPVNGLDKTDKIEGLNLAKFAGSYSIELLGRTGEPKPDRPVRVTLKHRDFKEPVQAMLKTDLRGRVLLGPLTDIVNVSAVGPEGSSRDWALLTDDFNYEPMVHARAGDTITFPYMGIATAPTREEFALFELRGSIIKADRFDAIALKDGVVDLRGLEAGDYGFSIKRGKDNFRIRVVDGPVHGGYVLGKARYLQLPALKPVQITSIATADETITIKLRDVSPFARVHVFATRYQPEYSAYHDLNRVSSGGLDWAIPSHAESTFLIGRNIGDEYRYILDRRQQRKFPGNLLERPALLLNPWAVRVAETGEQQVLGGDDFDRRPAPSEGGSGRGGERAQTVATGASHDFSPNLDFLADASTIHVNLVPDKEGVVKLTRKELGTHAMIHVVAVDPLHTVYRSVSLAEQPAKFVDLRLRQGLDPQGHFALQKQISILAPGQQFLLQDVAGSRFEAYDSLPKVYALYATLSKDPKLAEFAFILNWPKLSPEEKRKQYSKYACHELHFFLSRKDPEFFRTVVKPYLANKKDKTFLDQWLVEADLKEYLQPWQFQRLNTVERLLLAHRFAGEQARIARHEQDVFRLQPPNLDRFQMLFDTAVKGSEMDADAEGFRKAKGDAELKSRVPLNRADDAKDAPKPAAPMAPPAKEAAPGASDQQQSEAKFQRKGEEAEKSRDGRAGGKKIGKDKEVESLSDPIGGGGQGGRFHENDRARRSVQQLYRRLDPTMEWAENNYYHLLIQQQLAALVTVNPFWLDYAQHDAAKGPFFSRHFPDASRNFTEMMFALSVLDLPFEAGKHALAFEGGKMTFTPATPAIAFHEEVRPVAKPEGQMPILVSQNFYRHGDRYREVDGEKQDKFISHEFVIQTVYGCQVVVTNPTPSRQKLTVLVQVPTGSLPVAGGQVTRTLLIDLEPYRTQTIDYLFYFPQSGSFTHFPVHVAKNEVLVAATTPFTFKVVNKPSKLDTEAWAYVSQHGTNEQVQAMLRRENLYTLDLGLIAFRMKDKAFFESTLALLQERHMYHPVLWSYALLHNDMRLAQQYLAHEDRIIAECAGPIASPLLTIDPVTRHQYEHLEYKPLVNARAHALGQRRQIVNGRLHEQYHRFLKLLSYRKQLGDDDQLATTYYLLLQDRIEEAMASFAQVHPEKVSTKLQYDYCAAYLEMYGDEPFRARPIASRYLNHPVDRWRNAFAAIINQLDEIEGKGPKIADNDDRNQRQTQMASREPGFDFTIDTQKINLTWQNLEALQVNYYLMDVELLFSRNPFVQQSGGQFSAIRPNATQAVKLPAGQNKTALPLPENLQRRNVLVEVTAAGKTRSLPYYANAMNVQMNENYGQVRVTDATSGKALSKVYVKTYVRLADGQVKFHKDGYTDHRGRFDYASVSTPEHSPVQRFALLILSDDRGAQIREVSPPQQ